jgi:hypothetical protein
MRTATRTGVVNTARRSPARPPTRNTPIRKPTPRRPPPKKPAAKRTGGIPNTMSRNVIGRSQFGRPVRSNMKPGRKATRTLNRSKQKLVPSVQRGRRMTTQRKPTNIRTVRTHAGLRKSDFRRGFVRSANTGRIVKIGSAQGKAARTIRTSRSRTPQWTR